MSDQDSAEERATAAAEALAAEGHAVTARAVRERSGVRMTVAATAAREWNDQATQREQVPTPDSLRVRFDAIWTEAVALARAELAAEREGWQQRIAQAAAERDALALDVEQAEAALDTARTEAEQHAATAAAELAKTTATLTDERRRADRAEARAEAIEAERDRVIDERNRAERERDDLRTQLAQARKK